MKGARTMKNEISRFSGKYEFLSNFSYMNPHISYDGVEYGSVERAFQAAKIPDSQKELRRQFCLAQSNKDAKQLGKQVPLRPDWESIKVDIMYDLLKQKFAPPYMRQLLLDTKDAELIECNTWGDTFWGVYKGKGNNQLGKLLMKVREEIR